MYPRAAALCFFLLLPQLTSADPIVSFDGGLVTWEAVGEISISSPPFAPFFPAIPVGTPFTMRVTFNPDAVSPTPLAHLPDCMSVDFSGSLTLGSTTYSGTGLGFTNAMLPGSNCERSELTQFTFLSGLTAGDGTRFSSVFGASIIVASYRDLFVRDMFPEAPAGIGSFFINRLDHGGSVSGGFDWRVVEAAEMSPVPEPGTLTLFAVGAAAFARRVRAQRLRP